MRLNSNEVCPPSMTFCRLISYSRSHEKQMSGALSKVSEGIGLPHIKHLRDSSLMFSLKAGVCVTMMILVSAVSTQECHTSE